VACARSPPQLASACSEAERRVVACTLAHARALAVAAAEGWDVIVEDNVRLRRDAARELQRLLPAAAAAAAGSPEAGGGRGAEAGSQAARVDEAAAAAAAGAGVSLRYLGYLGKLVSGAFSILHAGTF
jgi:alkylation response protein AidB-like acyl-CoA dehydrogenase